MLKVLIVSLSLVYALVGAVVTPLQTCSATLENIAGKMDDANTHRQACEKSFFSSASCDTYWGLMQQILTLQINYQDCGRLTQENFYSDVTENIDAEGLQTRTTDSANAAATQKTVSDEATSTRSTVTKEATRTINTVVNATVAQNEHTRADVKAEATATRTLISAQHTKTDTFINDNTTTIIATTKTQAETTRADVDAQHTQTKTTLTTVIETQGIETRENTDAEAALTRDTITREAQTTRTTVNDNGVATRDLVASQAEKTRVNTTNEAAATRSHVTTQHTQTRGAVTAAQADIKQKVTDTSKATQDLVTAQGGQTRDTVAEQATNTNNVISSAFTANTASLNNLQSSQNNFTTMFVQILIMMDFSSSNARVDLFQRPASAGGYFEVMRSLVRNAIDTNKGYYSWTSYKVGQAENRWDDGERAYNKQPKPDYRSAWEYYRSAYLLATSSG